jgi:signal transduction histidine kinase
VSSRPEFHELQIATSYQGDKEWCFDPKKMERAFYNLLMNACEAAPRDAGAVKVNSRADSNGVEVLIADNGPGIPESVRDKLFQPFVTAGKENGVGLGLTIVRKIVTDHGGEVNLEATSAHGTVFKLWLPRHLGPGNSSDHHEAEQWAPAARADSAN